VDWLATTFTLRKLDGSVIATLHRPFFNFTDRWRVNVFKPDAVDPRLLVIIAAYKTSVDNDRNAAAAASSSSRH
jgi:hypothetical protein